MARLVLPSKKYENQWMEAVPEFKEGATSTFWDYPTVPTSPAEYIQRFSDFSQGKNLPVGFVPATMYWFIDNENFIGYANLRHALNEKLKERGGHIGYHIRSKYRKMGYGTKILGLALLKAKELRLKKVLITCDNSNIASYKIIEKNGGKLEDIIEVDTIPIRRYWIKV